VSIKRRLTAIRLDKIAGVDLPCQEHATVAIVKRAPTAPLLVLAKKTFDEALRGQLVSERISDVFWRAFDNQYAVREAFRESLADELADGGDGTAATEGFTAAMRTIAETAATLAREAGADPKASDLESAVEQAVEKWLKQQETSEMKITTKAALKAAVASFDPATTPVAHVGIIKQAAKDLNAEDELPADGPLAVEKQDPALAKALRDVAILKMSPEVRKHFDALDEAGQTGFLALSEADQASTVEKANATDPVVYKTAGGVEIRKSDGATAALLAKQLDETAAEVSVLKAGRTTDAIETRASTEFPNVAKGTAVAMLKTAAQLGEDTDAGKDVIKSLTTMNKGADRLFTSLGSTQAPEISGDVTKARTDFNSEVSKIMSRDSIGMADAMSKARVEQPDLFAEAYPETVEADAAE
jgi:hypothetical protein